jgi:hypothetical protein
MNKNEYTVTTFFFKTLFLFLFLRHHTISISVKIPINENPLCNGTTINFYVGVLYLMFFFQKKMLSNFIETIINLP